jgi:hypothetical protein
MTKHGKRLTRAASKIPEYKAVGQNEVRPGAQEADLDGRFDKLCNRLSVPLNVHAMLRWALVGVALAMEQPEFKSKRRRGKRKGSNHYPKDLKLLDVVEDVMGKSPEEDDTILKAVIEHAKKRRILQDNVERTTHPKRLRRLWDDRQRGRQSLAQILKYSAWDK